jgi:DNA-binding HxlR family transcriptional regulator
MPLRTDFATMNCSLARALDQIGDPWILLVLRECLLGAERFEQFGHALGAARKVLADRLAQMTAHGLLERVELTSGGKRAAYRITAKGEALVPALVALMQWGDAWISGTGREPIVPVGPRGAAIAPVALRTRGGQPVAASSLRWQPGAGAEPRTRAHLRTLAAHKDERSSPEGRFRRAP